MSKLKLTTLATQDDSASVPADTIVNGTAKAWVNFNGSGTVAIRRAFNVSSITDNGTGDYTVNFATAMVDANYSYNLLYLGGNSVYLRELQPSTLQAGSFRILAKYWSAITTSVLDDGAFLNVQIFR